MKNRKSANKMLVTMPIILGVASIITFQVESGDRMELQVSETEYGMFSEGDTGRLTFQGTRYLSFER